MNNRIMLAVGVLVTALLHADTVRADTASARRYIFDHYYKPLPPEAMTMPYKAFDSLIDRWSWIVSRQRWEGFNATMRGQHTGRIGITIEEHPLGRRVTYVVPGAPAYYSGLMVGDVIESVNGELLTRPYANGVYPEIRQKDGRPVMLEVRRGDQCFYVFTQRADFHEAAVTAMVRSRTLAIQIAAFQEGLHDEFRELTSHVDPATIDTVIIDVRDNGGGRVDEALKMVNEFVAGGDTMLSTHYRNYTEHDVALFDGSWYNPHRALIVVQNGESASASELFAGALKARAGAIIVGERSYGKGRMQRSVPRIYFGGSDTSIGGIIFTIAIFRPGGSIDIDERGLQPDVPLTAVDHAGVLPTLADVRQLRLKHELPTHAVIDSVVRLGGSALARYIWSTRGAPYAAMLDVESIVDRLPVPAWRCVANHDSLPTMFSRDDEEAIRRGIAGGTVAPVTDSIMRIEPLEALLQRMNITATPLHDSAQTTSVAIVSDVIARYGVRLRAYRGAVIVDYVVVNSRAYRIGLCVGDQIVTMNRVTKGADVDGAYAMLNAAQYDVVQLDVKRGQRQFVVKIEGARRSLQLVTAVRDGRIGYIGLPVISMQSVRDARDSIREMDRDGIAALVIDVRGTNVGSVAAAAELVSYFVKGGIFRGIRPVIAVDMTTRGAAEVLAYELQRSDDATIVGLHTAGAMARQVTIPTPSAVRYAFTQAYDREEPQRRVQPDHAMPTLAIDMDAVRTAAARSGDVTAHRTSLWHSTDIDSRHIEELRRRLPVAYQRVDDSVLAEAVYGSAARYYQLESVVRMLRGVTER